MMLPKVMPDIWRKLWILFRFFWSLGVALVDVYNSRGFAGGFVLGYLVAAIDLHFELECEAAVERAELVRY